MMPTVVASLTDVFGPVDVVAIERLLIAALLGGLVGWERERHGRAAGLRTQVLLCVGCCLVMLVSLRVPQLFGEAKADGILRSDPSRVAAQAIGGLGFLGAGAIIVLGRHIRGLTTAASIWVTAVIGLAVGCGYVVPAAFAWLVVMAALLGLARLEQMMPVKDRYVTLRMEFARTGRRTAELREMLPAEGLTMLDCKVDRVGSTCIYRMALKHQARVDFERLAEELMERFGPEGLERLAWE